MTFSAATIENLRRKTPVLDEVQWVDGVPLFSTIDLNPIELCGRTCAFCPRSDPNFYPNQNLSADPALFRKVAAELHELNYNGLVVLCGYGEPLLHRDILSLVRPFKGLRVEIVTNGDPLTVELIRALSEAGVTYFVVSLYDGPHQVEPFKAMFAETGADYMLRDRWHSKEDDYGLGLTNRGGTVSVGHQPPVDVTHPCHYPAYQLTVDWNGDALLCTHDWYKKVKFGNLNHASLLEVWKSSPMIKRRTQLMNGKRDASPCNKCNADGTLHGFNHAAAWRAS